MPTIKFTWTIRKPNLMGPPFSNYPALHAPPVYDLKCSNGYTAVMEKDQAKPRPSVYHAEVFDQDHKPVESMWIGTNLRDAKANVQEGITGIDYKARTEKAA